MFKRTKDFKVYFGYTEKCVVHEKYKIVFVTTKGVQP